MASDSYGLNLVSGLGHVDDQSGMFIKNDEKCIKSLKRIRREINADSKNEDNRTALLMGEIRIMKILIPLAMNYGAVDFKLLVEVTKVVVQLTMPLGVQDRTPKKSQERLGQLREFKAAFLRNGVLQSFMRLLDGALSSVGTKHNKEDVVYVELVLWLIRNLLAIPDAPVRMGGASSKDSHLMALQEDFIIQLDQEGVFSVLIFLTRYLEDEGNLQWNLVLTEIFYLLFRDSPVEEYFGEEPVEPNKKQEPIQLAETSSKEPSLSSSSSSKDDDLAKLLKRSRVKRVKAGRGLSSRHSRFGGLLKMSSSSTAEEDKSQHASRVVTNAFAMSNATKGSVAHNLKFVKDKRRVKKKKARKEDEVDTTVKHDHILARPVKSFSGSQRLRLVQGKFCRELVEKGYEALARALKKDFIRDDIRLVPNDRVIFLTLLGVCTGFERMRVQKEGLEETYRWDKSPVLAGMDRWSFHFVLKTCELIIDNKDKIREVEIVIGSLCEMMQVLELMQKSKDKNVLKFGEKLRNSVLFDIEEYGVIPKLLHSWSNHLNTYRHLCNIVVLGHSFLQVAAQMAEDGVVVKYGGSRRSKPRMGATKRSKTGIPWSAEETHALSEAVKLNGPNMKSFRDAVKDKAALGAIFDSSRTPQQLYNRWEHVSKTMQDNEMSLEEFITDELTNGTPAGRSDDSDSDGELSPQQQQKYLASLRQEKELAIEPLIRPYAMNITIYNLARLLDPEKAQSLGSECYLRHVQDVCVCFFLERIMKQNMGGLWHTSLFGIYRRALDVYSVTQRPRLAPVLKEIVKTFFEVASENPLAYVEVLFWRNKGENYGLEYHYEEKSERNARLRQQQLEQIRKERGYDSSDEEFYKKRGEDSTDLSEEELDLDMVKFCGVTVDKKSRGKRITFKPWSRMQTDYLLEKRRLLETMTEEEFCNELLEDPMFVDSHTLDDIKHQMTRLNFQDVELDVGEKQVPFEDTDIAVVLVHLLDNDMRPCLLWIQSEFSEDRSVLVPATESHFEWIKNPAVVALLKLLGFSNQLGFWRLPTGNVAPILSTFDTLLEKCEGTHEDVDDKLEAVVRKYTGTVEEEKHEFCDWDLLA